MQLDRTLNTLLNNLNNVRLATLLEKSTIKGKFKATYKLEEMNKEEESIINALSVKNFHTLRPKFKGVGVYKNEASN